ncbi:hypothetical protein BJY16_003020 [Actinoplanes octamycinicus]|uniref:Uncharacterized protein n=1 Tax=Actinoplanes octamycinicus TaxID=135948 RepID=A0A7W7M7B3_9ACTN|nr:hypothetical protein [Actinoplanes octamycinicus]MBB4739561.1 hypothetical protein [Actinoplanes octamycinicus]GIE54742.1 hypothetical protein Aoc01nite_01440 [Actinoplanes octamycinicus]
MLDDAKPPVIAANIFGRTMLAFPALLLIAWTAAAQEEGDTWVNGDGPGAMIFSLALAALALAALLIAPLNRFRRARPAVVLGWSLGALITVTTIASLTYTG